MKIIANRNLNLFSASTVGGLIYVQMRVVKIVPDDVKDHPQWNILVKSGTVAVLGDEAARGIAILNGATEEQENEAEEEQKSEGKSE
jgi:hypothetical protein